MRLEGFEREGNNKKYRLKLTILSITKEQKYWPKYKSDEESHSESEFYYPEQDEQVKTEKNNMANVATHGDENSSNSPEELQMFVQEQKSENTVKKTTSDVKCFYRFLGSINKRNVQILDLPPEELDHLLEKFFKDVQKVSGDEYEPRTLTGSAGSQA